MVTLLCLGPHFQKITHHFLLHGSLPPTNLEKNLKPCINGDEGSLTYLCLSCSSVSIIISHMPVSSLVMNEASVINDDEGTLTFLCLSCSSVPLTHACIIAGDE